MTSRYVAKSGAGGGSTIREFSPVEAPLSLLHQGRPAFAAEAECVLLGRIEAVYRYPVKSLAGELLASANVLADGLEGDRIHSLIVDDPLHERAGKTYRGKENNLLHTLPDVERARDVAAERGVAVALSEAGRHFDLAAVSLLFDTWLTDLSQRAGLPLEPLRFRPNLFARSEPGFTYAEPQMIGLRLQAGTVVLEVVDTNRRCVTPTYDLQTGESNPAILRTIAQERDNVVGVYCRVVTPGTLRPGDTIRLAA